MVQILHIILNVIGNTCFIHEVRLILFLRGGGGGDYPTHPKITYLVDNHHSSVPINIIIRDWTKNDRVMGNVRIPVSSRLAEFQRESSKILVFCLISTFAISRTEIIITPV